MNINDHIKRALRSQRVSTREIETVEHVIKGLSNDAIGELLGIDKNTVTAHLNRVYTKTGLKSRAQLIVWCASQAKPKDIEAETYQEMLNMMQHVTDNWSPNHVKYHNDVAWMNQFTMMKNLIKKAKGLK